MTVLRLDPLTDEDIAAILDSRGDIDDAEGFIKAAKERRGEGLLANPQTLKMLADVVCGGGGWPKSRMQTFEMASRQMVREHNEEHQAAQESGSPPAPEQLLDAAGRLCALQLISEGAGYTLRGQPDEEYLSPDQCDYDSPEVLPLALATKLFKGVSSNRFSPIHRHLAEFLGGRHLAKVIQDGLPARRVISLMTGEDDTVVTEMRGLSAWLAAHSSDAQADLIERDPIGVGLYGDIGESSLDEKRALLKSLRSNVSSLENAYRLDYAWRIAEAFRAFATSEMEPELREVLTDSSRSADHQMFTDFVLRVLSEGMPLPDLGPLLLEIVRDETRLPSVNTSALNAFIHSYPDSEDRTSELKGLLVEIQSGYFSDPDDELLGILLAKLYPRDLPPSEVWDFYGKGKPDFFGSYYYFWEINLVENSSNEQVAELLDHLTKWLPDSASSPDILPVNLLAQGLKTHGDQLDPVRLYKWLDVGCRKKAIGVNATGAFAFQRRDASIREIRSWLEKRPEIQKAVILEGVVHCPDKFNLTAFRHQHLHLSSLPPDFGLWCLEQAVSMADAKPLVAERLLEWASGAYQDHVGDAGLSLAVLQEQARKNVRLEKRLDQLLSPAPIDQEHLEYQEKRPQEEEEEQQQWIDHVRSNKPALLENRAAPGLLYHMADWYFSGQRAIEERLRGDRDLIDAVLQGLRGTINRGDVPDQDEILRLREQNRMHYLGLPFLAGITEAEKTTDVSRWKDDRVRKAVAFYYGSHLSNHKPQWYRRLLAERPEVVAEVHVQFADSGFRNGREHIDKLSELALDHDHTQVSRHASLPLLRAFPTQCKAAQIQDLKYLLWAALQFADRASLRDLIGEKCSQKSIDDTQHVYWLATGIVVAPEVYGDRLEEFVQGREDRSSHLMVFLEDREKFPSDALGNPLLELLVRLVGKYAEPGQFWDGSNRTYMGSEARTSEFVHDLIKSLSTTPEKEASDALSRLIDDESLSSWHNELSQAQDTQGVIRRDAGYRHPDIEQVCQTLNDRTPANAADLAALLVDRLHELARQIRTGNTDDWHHYWNEPHGQSPTPKHEDRCRKALLSALRLRLPPEVDAQPEGQYANDKRADIRVSCRDFQVPVEIKKNLHRDLWSAPRNQLIAKYTTDPATSGHGIYLVFWFGRIGRKGTPPPTGTPPTTAAELQDRLQATLSPAEARKISICVVDVSRPDN